MPVDATWRSVAQWGDLAYLQAHLAGRLLPLELRAARGDGCASTREPLREAMVSGEELVAALAARVGQAALLPGEDTTYMAQHPLLDQVVSLAEDLVPPELPSPVQTTAVWIGTDGTVTALHTDSYENLFLQVAGYKYVRLYPPSETRRLYVGGRQGEGAQGNLSQIRLEEPAEKTAAEFPESLDAEYVEMVVGPGDAFFIPSGTWHFLRSLTPSVSINFWH